MKKAILSGWPFSWKHFRFYAVLQTVLCRLILFEYFEFGILLSPEIQFTWVSYRDDGSSIQPHFNVRLQLLGLFLLLFAMSGRLLH